MPVRQSPATSVAMTTQQAQPSFGTTSQRQFRLRLVSADGRLGFGTCRALAAMAYCRRTRAVCRSIARSRTASRVVARMLRTVSQMLAVAPEAVATPRSTPSSPSTVPVSLQRGRMVAAGTGCTRSRPVFRDASRERARHPLRIASRQRPRRAVLLAGCTSLLTHTLGHLLDIQPLPTTRKLGRSCMARPRDGRHARVGRAGLFPWIWPQPHILGNAAT